MAEEKNSETIKELRREIERLKNVSHWKTVAPGVVTALISAFIVFVVVTFRDSIADSIKDDVADHIVKSIQSEGLKFQDENITTTLSGRGLMVRNGENSHVQLGYDNSGKASLYMLTEGEDGNKAEIEIRNDDRGGPYPYLGMRRKAPSGNYDKLVVNGAVDKDLVTLQGGLQVKSGNGSFSAFEGKVKVSRDEGDAEILVNGKRVLAEE